MKVLLINGSPHKAGCTYTALCELAAQFQKNGVETEIFQVDPKAQSCIACGACKGKGRCAFEGDGVNECIKKIEDSDGVIIGSPVYYANISGGLASTLDRVFYAKRSFAGKPGAAVVSCRRGGAGSAFDRINKYFSISCMPIVSSSYWNSVHGNTPEEVVQDKEGMQVLRTLANNMTWMIRCIEEGKKAGIEFPEMEAKITTNFIR